MTSDDIRHLERCVELAAEAAARGDDPFGSVLVSADGEVVAERSNRIATSGDLTAHPELHLTQWASVNMTPEQRSEATMYTSGEHCPMCAAAQIWVGIGRLVYVLSAEQIREASSSAVSINMTAREMIERAKADIVVDGPCEELGGQVRALFG